MGTISRSPSSRSLREGTSGASRHFSLASRLVPKNLQVESFTFLNSLTDCIFRRKSVDTASELYQSWLTRNVGAEPGGARTHAILFGGKLAFIGVSLIFNRPEAHVAHFPFAGSEGSTASS